MNDSSNYKVKELIQFYQLNDYNEADTRHKIIDELIHNVLSWPKELVSCESFINPGYADYRLTKKNGDDILFIEAKRAGEYFNLPKNFNKNKLSKYILIDKLLSDDNLKKAIEQVRTYCIEVGCEFACVTNSKVWIFFKTFEKSKNWKDLKAFVITDLTYFKSNYTAAINNFGFTSLFEGSLKSLLGSGSRKNREIFYPKEYINHYKDVVTQNNYAKELRPIALKYFGVIDVSNHDFMDHCYVSEREHDIAFSNFQSIIKDSLSPYFMDYGVQDFLEDKSGGKFGSRIKKGLKEIKHGEVLILFGGKGSGKSTFLKKLLYYNTPDYLRNHSKIVIVDVLQTTEDRKNIYNSIWNQLAKKLDSDELLKSDRESLIKHLYSNLFQIQKKQLLYGLNEGTDIYNEKVNNLVNRWVKDKKLTTERLVAYWKRKKRGTIVVIDNTDQFSPMLQDYCFSTAQEIAANLGCLVIISMREERFHSSRLHGTLDAYQNAGFHISSPITQAVFQKRISYVLKVLDEKYQNEVKYYTQKEIDKLKGCIKLFEILDNEFNKVTNSPLSEFLTACAHGNIRLALELFRDFIISGYTNVDEWISVSNYWTIKIHQVLKPFMIPYRFFYDESQSSVPNVFQIRDKINGSHFTGLRIYNYLTEGKDPKNPPYISISELKDYFSEYFDMVEDFEINIDIFLKHDIVESNNRIDFYSDQVDRVRITNYGYYFFKTLISYFTYLELVASDCGYFNEKVANEIIELSKEEWKLYNLRKKEDRVKIRLKKARTFIDYLIEEEEKENDFYQIKIPSKFSSKILDYFIKEEPEVLKSAAKNS